MDAIRELLTMSDVGDSHDPDHSYQYIFYVVKGGKSEFEDQKICIRRGV